MTKTLDPKMVQANSASEAEAMVRELHQSAIIEAWEATDGDGRNYYDVLVWASEADAENDDGAKAIERYRVYAA